MDLFADVSVLQSVMYGLAGPGTLVALLGLVALSGPNPRIVRVVARVALVLLLLLCSLLLAATVERGDGLLEGISLRKPSLCVLAGAAALSVLLGLAALLWPRRRLVRHAGIVALVAAVVVGGWVVMDIRSWMLAEFFWQDGDTLVRFARDDQTAQRLAGPLDWYFTALYLTALAALVAVPLLAAAGLRARLGHGPRGATALAIAAVALPPVILAEATLVHVLSCLNVRGCAPMLPVDRTPDLVRMWTRLAEQRIAVPVAGLIALAIGSVAAIRLARTGAAAGNRRLLAALAVFLVGAAAYMHTRAHAEDTANGPRRAFVGAPFHPYGEVADNWVHPDFVAPPTATTCTPIRNETRVALVIAASGERVDGYEDEDDVWRLRGTAAWERSLIDELWDLAKDGYYAGRPPTSRVVDAVIDDAAPLVRVMPYLRIAAAHGVVEVVLVGRHADIAATRTLGDVRVDKRCSLGSLRLEEDLELPAELVTWGDLVRWLASEAEVR